MGGGIGTATAATPRFREYGGGCFFLLIGTTTVGEVWRVVVVSFFVSGTTPAIPSATPFSAIVAIVGLLPPPSTPSRTADGVSCGTLQ